jgi:signal transduction histidine kinase
MVQPHSPVIRDGKLLLLKWLLVFAPPTTALLGHTLLGLGRGHADAGRLGDSLLVALLLLVLTLAFAETLFRVLGRLQAEALAREQDVLTMGAVMQERERLSRELHDGVAQLVADLLLRLDTIKELVSAGQPHDAEAELERLREVADEIYEDVEESITGLRSSVTERGLVRALQDYVDRFEERHGVTVDFRADAAPARLSPLAALQVFRLVQEGLTNIRKHSGAREATVSLTADASDQLSVVIADDGRGFVTEEDAAGNGRKLGLTSMRERVEALGGRFEVSSQPGSGTRVIATIPIPLKGREKGHAGLAASPG